MRCLLWIAVHRLRAVRNELFCAYCLQTPISGIFEYSPLFLFKYQKSPLTLPSLWLQQIKIQAWIWSFDKHTGWDALNIFMLLFTISQSGTPFTRRILMGKRSWSTDIISPSWKTDWFPLSNTHLRNHLFRERQTKIVSKKINCMIT